MNEKDIIGLTNILNARPTDELVIIKELTNHHKTKGNSYQVNAFTTIGGKIELKQKTYPLEGITLSKSGHHTEENPFYVGKGKYYYINYYVV